LVKKTDKRRRRGGGGGGSERALTLALAVMEEDGPCASGN
jgi:hypothetical protein